MKPTRLLSHLPVLLAPRPTLSILGSRIASNHPLRLAASYRPGTAPIDEKGNPLRSDIGRINRNQTELCILSLGSQNLEFISLSAGSKNRRSTIPLIFSATASHWLHLFFLLTSDRMGAWRRCVATRLYTLYVTADESTSGWEFYHLFINPHNKLPMNHY